MAVPCRDVTAAELLIQQHQGLRAELEAREGSFGAAVAAATELLQRGHHAADKVGHACHPATVSLCHRVTLSPCPHLHLCHCPQAPSPKS